MYSASVASLEVKRINREYEAMVENTRDMYELRIVKSVLAKRFDWRREQEVMTFGGEQRKS